MTPTPKDKPITEVLSEPRLSTYKKPGVPLKKALAKYRWNVRLSAALGEVLDYTEVILRNSINSTICKHYGPNWLLYKDTPITFNERELDHIKAVVERLEDQYPGMKLTNDDLVAHMSLGFWENMFSNRHDSRLWLKKGVMEDTFPNMPEELRFRLKIRKKLHWIRIIRNRVSHREPIWNNEVPVNFIYISCRRLIAAISTEALAELDMVDRFPEVWKERDLYV